MGRKAGARQNSPNQDDDLALGEMFDEGEYGGYGGFDVGDTIYEEDEEDEEYYEPRYAAPTQKGNKGGQQQRQRGAGQDHHPQKQQKGGGQQKANKGEQNQKKQQSQKGQRGQDGQKAQKGKQRKMGWDSPGGGTNDWGGSGGTSGWGETGGSNNWADSGGDNNWADSGGNNNWADNGGNNNWAESGGNNNWAESGGTNDWGNDNSGRGNGGGWGDDDEQSKTPSRTYPSHQQRRLAALLNQQMTSGTERGRTNYNQQHGRSPTAAEKIKAATSGRTPSRTLWYAATGSQTNVLDGGSRGGPHTTVQIHESGGAALEEADRALYSRQRPASQRIHWMFSPTKDERVASLLDWVQAMSHGLATLGVHHFLRTQQRGALVANADYRPWKAPNEPAFDWVTFEDVVETHDRTLQESMAFYDTEYQVLVFVFLLSRSGNSLAMWRRKLTVPTAIRKQNRAEILRITKKLAESKTVITVDELPISPATKSKKKWFNVRW